MHNTSNSPNTPSPAASVAAAPATAIPARQALLREAELARTALRQPLAGVTREFLAGVAHLPAIAPRTIYRDKTATGWPRRWVSHAQWLTLIAESQAQFEPQVFTEKAYYSTFYGTPLAYGLVLDAAQQHGLASLAGKKIVDYGYGAIGSLRLMAQAGAQVVGIDVDTALPALYNQPSDVGSVALNPGTTGSPGSLKLVSARFPFEKHAVAGVGTGNDVIISKNTLKKGYVTPEHGSVIIDTAPSNVGFLRGFYLALRPGGLLIIYNISRKLDLSAANYRPANDGRAPFSRAEFAEAGFTVLAHDFDDSPQARRFGTALGWGGPQGMGDLEVELFATVTVLRRPL